MKAAIVLGRGRSPVYSDFEPPAPREGASAVTVSASALSRTTKSRASGSHYDSPSDFPFVAGIDGVGRQEDGTRVYFAFPVPPNGSLAEKTVVDPSHCVALPSVLSDVQAAALANPGLSSWAACEERAHLRPGETVLVHGATGVAGRLAVQVAKHLGARTVIATGRDREALGALVTLGADTTIPIGRETKEFEQALVGPFVEGVDVVLDYLWGPTAEHLLVAAARYGREGRPLRYVSIGSIAGSDITLPSAVLRSSEVMLMGSGTGSVPLERLLGMLGQLFDTAATRRWEVAVRTVPLQDIETVWSESDGGPRIVLTVGE